MTLPLKKYIFIQDDPFYLPKVLDKFLREYHDSTVGMNIQSVSQGKRTVVGTALDLLRVYGPVYFQWKLRRYLGMKIKKKVINDPLGYKSPCYSVGAVADKYGLPVHSARNVNDSEFRRRLRELGVELIVSISGTQFYGKQLREQTPRGIINCHGGLLPRYRGLMPSFWTLANGEREGGGSVHFVDGQLDNGPILVQRRYRIHARDTLEDIMARGKDLAAEAVLEAVHRIESDKHHTFENPQDQATHYSMPTRADVRRFRQHGHQFV